MKNLLPLLRQFFMPFNGWPWMHYLGLVLLPVTCVVGLWFPHLGFSLAVWDYVLLLAIPFMLAPKILRALICNRRLALVPGFALHAVLTAFLFTLLQASFLGFFAWLYDIDGWHLRNVMQLFVVSSIYVVVMQYAVTTAWAMVALSLLPVTCIAAILYITQNTAHAILGDDHLVWLLAACFLGWLAAGLRTRQTHQYKREHASVETYKSAGYQRAALAQWLLQGSSALADPDATLLLGYPATLTSRLRVMLYMVFTAPVVFTLFLTMVGFGSHWAWPPSALEILIATSVFPTTFAGFQNVEWVTRLRLIWLRRPALRKGLWQFLEKQMAISLTLLMLPCGVLTLCGLLFSQLPANLMLHYPLLVLVFNALHAYYVVCARTSAWPAFWGLILAAVGSTCLCGALWVAIAWHDAMPLIALEALVIAGGVKFRMMARQKLQTLDWLVVKPFQTRHAM